MVKSAYIHIPFCKSKCHYCSFVSFNKLEQKKEYLEALKQEISYFYNNDALRTLYFGGGTPSLLTLEDFAALLRLFNVNKDTEITIELNPDDVSYDYVRRLYDLGVNRLSVGCQTFDDKILKLINRRHNAGEVINAVKIIQDAGFKNVSLDFIYGLPEQTQEGFYNDLSMAVGLGIQHISLYGLKIEEGCYFYKNSPDNLPEDDLQADMYLGAVELLSSKGFKLYEVSNFSKKSFESKHNLNYWNNEEYYGFGVAAHGYVNGVRYGNKETIETYIENPLEHKQSKLLSVKEKLEEEIFLGFRRMSGIEVSQINSKYNIDFESKYGKILEKYIALKLMEKTKQGYKLTIDGVLVSNVVLADFLED